MMLRRIAATFVVAVFSMAPPARAALDPSVFGSLAFDQRPGASLPPDTLTDEAGRATSLPNLIDGRPTLIVLEYLRCPNLCGLVLGGLLDGLARTPRVSGRDYNVLAISIDPHETVADAAAARRDYEDRYGKELLAGWRFVTAPEATVRRVADAVGFPYRWDPAVGQFAHPAGAVVAMPSGIVSKYLFGVSYDPLDLRLALADASEGRIGSATDRLLLLCYGYDPKTGTYQPAILTILKAAGAATVLLGGAYLAAQFRHEFRG